MLCEKLSWACEHDICLYYAIAFVLTGLLSRLLDSRRLSLMALCRGPDVLIDSFALDYSMLFSHNPNIRGSLVETTEGNLIWKRN
jgi:hypothetical protein